MDNMEKELTGDYLAQKILLTGAKSFTVQTIAPIDVFCIILWC